jgi:hypothetical protein
VRRGWSNIITIFQWVLIFEQSVNHRRGPRWCPQIGAAATWLSQDSAGRGVTPPDPDGEWWLLGPPPTTRSVYRGRPRSDNGSRAGARSGVSKLFNSALARLWRDHGKRWPGSRRRCGPCPRARSAGTSLWLVYRGLRHTGSQRSKDAARRAWLRCPHPPRRRCRDGAPNEKSAPKDAQPDQSPSENAPAPEPYSPNLRASVAFPLPTSRAARRMPIPSASVVRTAASRSADYLPRPAEGFGASGALRARPGASSVLPEALEADCRQFGVLHRVLNISVTEVVLQCAHVLPVVR